MFKWSQLFGIVANPEDFTVGDVVSVTSNAGVTKRVNVDAIQAFTTKAGKAKVRALVSEVA